MDGTLKQVLAFVVLGELLLAVGLNFGMHSVTLIQVPGDPGGFLSADQLNWSIAATSLGGVLGGLLGAPVAPILGVRRLLLLTMPLYALGSLAVGFGGHFGWTLSGRVVMFVALGLSEGCVRGYVSEIVPPKRRALFSALLNFMVYLGQVLVLAVAPLLHWQVLFIVVGVVPAALCLSGLLFLPNSAKWLLSRGHSEEEAMRSIQFFRGTQVDAAAEVRSIHDSLQHAHADGAALPVWTLLRQPGTWRPLLLASIQMVLFAWCGGATLVLFTAFVMTPVRLPLSEYQRAMLPAALSTFVCVPGGITIERYGRLPVLRLGGALSAIGCATIAAYFFLAVESQERLGWIVLAGACLTQVAFVGMIANVAFNYVTELLPNKTRTLGANIVLVMLNLSEFMLLKMYPLIKDGVGLGGGFVIHSLVSLCQVLFATFCLKETKGLSLEQIQHLFQNAEKVAELPLHVAESLPGSKPSMSCVDAPK